MERCANCEKPIGNLETPHVWREHVVCAACHAELAAKIPIPYASPHSPGMMQVPPRVTLREPLYWKAVIAVSAVGVLAAVWLLIKGDLRPGSFLLLGSFIVMFAAKLGALVEMRAKSRGVTPIFSLETPVRKETIMSANSGCGGGVLGGCLGVVLGVAVLVGAVFVAIAVFSDSQRTGSAPSSPMPPPAEVITVDPATLVREFVENEIAANARYKGRWVSIGGTVDRVAEDIMGSPYVTLQPAPGSFRAVQAMFPKDRAESLATLKPGQRVQLHGRVDGLMMNVILRDSRIETSDATTRPR